MASIKIERDHVEQLARALCVPLQAEESGAALFRRCLERARSLNEQAREIVSETHNAEELAALAVFGNAVVMGLGGEGERATNGTAARPVEPAGT